MPVVEDRLPGVVKNPAAVIAEVLLRLPPAGCWLWRRRQYGQKRARSWQCSGFSFGDFRMALVTCAVSGVQHNAAAITPPLAEPVFKPSRCLTVYHRYKAQTIPHLAHITSGSICSACTRVLVKL